MFILRHLPKVYPVFPKDVRTKRKQDTQRTFILFRKLIICGKQDLKGPLVCFENIYVTTRLSYSSKFDGYGE
jgi:hypothetical protein